MIPCMRKVSVKSPFKKRSQSGPSFFKNVHSNVQLTHWSKHWLRTLTGRMRYQGWIKQKKNTKNPYSIHLQGMRQKFSENPLISPQSHSLKQSVKASFTELWEEMKLNYIFISYKLKSMSAGARGAGIQDSTNSKIY